MFNMQVEFSYGCLPKLDKFTLPPPVRKARNDCTWDASASPPATMCSDAAPAPCKDLDVFAGCQVPFCCLMSSRGSFLAKQNFHV